MPVKLCLLDGLLQRDEADDENKPQLGMRLLKNIKIILKLLLQIVIFLKKVSGANTALELVDGQQFDILIRKQDMVESRTQKRLTKLCVMNLATRNTWKSM